MRFRNVLLSALLVFVTVSAQAADVKLKPFVLASNGEGMIAEKAEQARVALTGAGFSIVGDYSPYPETRVLIVTSDELKKNAAASEHGGYGAVQRVAVTRVNNEVQVVYTNPVYMANVYRMKDGLGGVSARLEGALGRVEEFGVAQGVTAGQARYCHSMFGMEAV